MSPRGFLRIGKVQKEKEEKLDKDCNKILDRYN